MNDVERMVQEIERDLNKRFPYPNEGISVEDTGSYYTIKSNTVSGHIEMIIDREGTVLNIEDAEGHCIEAGMINSTVQDIVSTITLYWAKTRQRN